MINVETIEVCTDCIQVLANGVETAEQERAAEAMAEQWPDGGLVPGCPIGCCPENAEPWFSMQPCEGCTSPLGGDRFHATWIQP